MNCYLVDFENVRTDGIKALNGVQPGDAMVVFYSENCKSITLDVLESIISLKLKYSSFKVKVGTKNALDFQLASYLGYLIGQGGADMNYCIVSEDKGFEAIADFWREQGVCVSCVSLKEPLRIDKESQKELSRQETRRKKSKVSLQDLATLDEVKPLVGAGGDPDAVLKIFNQYKTKQAICNGMAKHFKDSKRASDIYKKLKPLLKTKNKS